MLSVYTAPQTGSVSSRALQHELPYTSDTIPPLPANKDEGDYVDRRAWTVRFTGFLSRLIAPYASNTAPPFVVSSPGLATEVPMGPALNGPELLLASVGSKATYISAATRKYREQLFEVTHTQADGNCYWAALAIVVYGDSQFWPHVKAQHRIWLDGVLANLGHPRHSSYSKWADDVLDGKSNRDRLRDVGAWQSTTTAQLSADIYGLTFAILEPVYESDVGSTDYEGAEGRRNGHRGRAMKENGQHLLTVGSMYGHPADPVRFVLFTGSHFDGARPRVDLPAHPSDYELPSVFYTALRPWRQFCKTADGVPPRLIPPPLIPEPRHEDIRDAGGTFIRCKGSLGSTQSKHDLQPLSPTLSGSGQLAPAASVQISICPALRVPTATLRETAFAPDRDRAITAWRHRGSRPPDTLWVEACSFQARDNDIRHDMVIMNRMNPSTSDTVRTMVSDVQKLELQSLDIHFDEKALKLGVQTLLDKVNSLQNSPSQDLDNFIELMQSRLVRTGMQELGSQATVYEAALNRVLGDSQSQRLRLSLSLGLYLFGRWSIHQTCNHPAVENLDGMLSELRKHLTK